MASSSSNASHDVHGDAKQQKSTALQRPRRKYTMSAKAREQRLKNLQKYRDVIQKAKELLKSRENDSHRARKVEKKENEKQKQEEDTEKDKQKPKKREAETPPSTPRESKKETPKKEKEESKEKTQEKPKEKAPPKKKRKLTIEEQLIGYIQRPEYDTSTAHAPIREALHQGGFFLF